jgi:hypothetical protein
MNILCVLSDFKISKTKVSLLAIHKRGKLHSIRSLRRLATWIVGKLKSQGVARIKNIRFSVLNLECSSLKIISIAVNNIKQFTLQASTNENCGWKKPRCSTASAFMRLCGPRGWLRVSDPECI